MVIRILQLIALHEATLKIKLDTNPLKTKALHLALSLIYSVGIKLAYKEIVSH